MQFAETKMPLTIDHNRVLGELETLASFSDAPPPAVTRVLFTQPDLGAREFLQGACIAAGLSVRADAVGNLFARWDGLQPELPAVATGSHCDAIPHSGRYDGTVGVWGGLEAIRALRAAGFQPRRSIELIMFTAEEPTRYGIGCLGSRLMAGVLDPDAADALKDDNGRTLAETRAAHGHTQPLESVRVGNGTYHAFVELHIEQGPLLEERQLAIGVVTGIAAPAAIRVDYEGAGGHAGAVLMPQRRDALLPAAELALAVSRAAHELGGENTVATTGVLDVFPRAINSIPSRTHLEIDVRDTQLARRDAVLDHILACAREIGERQQQHTTVEVLSRDPPVQCAADIVSAIEQSCADAGATFERMISRAYHDCLFMALICPSAMIFIPCRCGVSHHPDEFARPQDIETGIEVLARTLARLAAQPPGIHP
jgi:N-carbamoyl-L-amino-acid hydrolase